MAADKILQEMTPVQSWRDADGLKDFIESTQLKAEIAQDEVKRLNGKLTRQDERIEELRETHHLESRSQSDLIDQLRKQLEESEALVNAGIGSSSHLEEEVARYKADLEKAQTEVERLKNSVKDEEEKRTKAVSLLKTVRQKLVKAEKERDDAVKDAATLKDREKAERDKDKVERANLQAEIDKIKVEKDAAVAGVRAQSDRDLTALKERYERDFAALKAQVELEAITSKSSFDQALSTASTRISVLENAIQTLSAEKDSLFDQVQLRQAEVESSQSLLEVLRSRDTEFDFQIRESANRIALLNEELADARQELEQHVKVREPSNSAEDVARLLSAAEARYEAKLSEAKRKLAAVEAERTGVEAEWSRKLAEKVQEAEKWKRAVESTVQDQQDNDTVVNELKRDVERLKFEARSYRNQLSQLEIQHERLADVEDTVKLQRSDFSEKISALEQQVEEAKARESQARTQNKTLRDELRKVQSSAALLERQRNPGIGYWSAARQDGIPDSPAPVSQVTSSPSSRVNSPLPGSPAPSGNDEEVNLEYLRNVILQFLEHKEMRPNLVRVLSIILHFTPQETRRLIAKV
ncbi:hypothetical protein FA95DRAFT_202400 [Auriscalpium vulgare]|uniref:Uncharacterized protein n=1 Tax=Auriscalpium vulgare TaxID=40419 RepID=A0ACB8S7G4_9AGAM|nr:hypothetical protein FA95DRAFT_202400 [Auriscalpium vulgare]